MDKLAFALEERTGHALGAAASGATIVHHSDPASHRVGGAAFGGFN